MNKKNLVERNNAIIEEMEAMVNTCDTETRAFTPEENEKYEALQTELNGIKDALQKADALEEARSYKPAEPDTETRSQEEIEERAFADYILGKSEELRTGEQNVTYANNGAVIPVSIANKIIKTVQDRCPILAGSTLYRVKGTLKVPVWGLANSTHDITVGYQTEFSEITADAGKFTSVDLGGYLAGALTLIGRSVENNAVFNITQFIIDQMSEYIANWIEGQLLVGTGSSAAQGATNTSNSVSAASITADALIDVQAAVKQAFQAKACWTMAPATFTAVKKLKDGQGRYLLQDDVTSAFPYRLLGKPVYLSDNMPAASSGNACILYGDYSGLSVNIRENISIEVLREKYATQHAIGVVAWFEFDSKITDAQKLAVLTLS